MEIAQIALRMAHSESDAFVEFSEIFCPLIIQWITGYGYHLDDARRMAPACVMEVAALVPLNYLEIEEGKVESWVRTKVRNKFVRQWGPGPNAPQEIWDALLLYRAVTKLLRDLSPVRRSIIETDLTEPNLPVEQIAARLGLTLDIARHNRREAYKQLLARLASDSKLRRILGRMALRPVNTNDHG